MFSTLSKIQVTFKDYSSLRELITNFPQTKAKPDALAFDLQTYVEVKMKYQNALQCFLFFLEKKEQQNTSVILHHLIINQVASLARSTLDSQLSDQPLNQEQIKGRTAQLIQLVTFYILVQSYTEYPFKKVVKQYDTLKVSMEKLESIAQIDFFSWFLLSKLHQDKSLRCFKLIKLGNSLYPVQVEDKTAKIKVERDTTKSDQYAKGPIGQKLEESYMEYVTKRGEQPIEQKVIHESQEETIEVEEGLYDQSWVVKAEHITGKA